MYEKLDCCPVCEGDKFVNHIICKDFTVSKEEFVVVKCISCNFYLTNPRPEEQELHKYYESDDYISHQNKSNNLINFVYRLARKFTLRNKRKLITKYQSQGSLLDIGCGTGHFLKTCQEAGWNIMGVEPSHAAGDQAKKKGISISSSIHKVPKDQQFDVITLWHVLEHIPDINSFLKKTHELLSKKGTLFVAVPNIESLDAQRYKQYWAAYDLPRHLYHFSQSTMKKMMNKHGFKLINVLPMKLDAYYVSLLSEKYKNNGRTNYTNSILNACKSNSYAKKHNNNYSSLIYILHKS